MQLIDSLSPAARFLLGLALVLSPATSWAQDAAAPPEDQTITELSMADLLNVEVTSVSKKTQSLSDSPAAVFVISNEDLRRSGVTNIPDALRMVPGLNVARIDANKWAVTARGFNGRFGNKLLVLIDGRSVYTPTFSGVYWESLDVILDDVERIEVIRGPGATLWGANAVNGVINIMTKHSADTQGGRVSLAGGNLERAAFAARYGAALGERTYGRAYVKGFQRSEFEHSASGPAGDDWDLKHFGFRVDSQLQTRDGLTVQGDFYTSSLGQTLVLPAVTPPFATLVEDAVDMSGANLLARWQHTSSHRSQFTIQVFHDRFERDEFVVRETRSTTDIEFQHQLSAGERQDIVWGLGYRHTRDDFRNSPTLVLDPAKRNNGLFNAFFQDEIILVPRRLHLTLGSKFEHNDYSGWEIQPNARLFWAARPRHKIWASVSRAVRTPSRAEHDSAVVTTVMPPFPPNPLPVALVTKADPGFDSEDLIAYELGYRVVPIDSLSLDLTVFHQDYTWLRGTELGSPVFQGTFLEQPLVFNNENEGSTSGFELAAIWQAADWWSWDLAYSLLEMNIDVENDGSGPRHQLSLRSIANLSKVVDLDLWLRYVDDVQAMDGRTLQRVEIDSYTTLDIRVAWRPIQEIELSLVGQNLLQDQHLEYVQEILTLPTEVPRGVYGSVAWSF